MKTFTLLLFALFFLPSCAAIQHKVAEQRMANECPPDVKGTTADHMRCVRDIVFQETPNEPGLPIFIANADAAIKVDAQYDAGKISAKRHEELISDIRANAIAGLGVANAAYNQQRAQTFSNSMGQISQYYENQAQMHQQAIRPVVPQPSYMCTQNGNFTTCNPY